MRRVEGAAGTTVRRWPWEQRHGLTERAHKVVNGEGAQIGAKEPTQLDGVHLESDHTEDHKWDKREEVAGVSPIQNIYPTRESNLSWNSGMSMNPISFNRGPGTWR